MQHKHDAQHEALMNMKQLRLELRAWANWWLRHEYGKGYAARSSCDRLKDPITCVTTVSERDINPPPGVIRYDRRIELSTCAGVSGHCWTSTVVSPLYSG
ncbi:MAG: hypothetical protein SAqTSA_21090 [Shewanella algae]